MVTTRVLVGMTIGALVAAVGALFLGEYEFDELLPIVAGPLLGFVVAEIVVSIGQHRSRTLAVVVGTWSAAAVLLAGWLDTNENEPIKAGAYIAAGLAFAAAGARCTPWRRGQSGRSATTEHETASTSETLVSAPES